jgi:hypothetical protein
LGNDAATRFQQAIAQHGGDAYRALAQRGVKLNYDITSEYGGKSAAKRTLYIKETKRLTEIRYGDDELIIRLRRQLRAGAKRVPQLQHRARG